MPPLHLDLDAALKHGAFAHGFAVLPLALVAIPVAGVHHAEASPLPADKISIVAFAVNPIVGAWNNGINQGD